MALALDLLEERALVGLVDVPEAEIVLVDAQLSGPTGQLPPQPQEDARPLAQEQGRRPSQSGNGQYYVRPRA